MQEVPVPSDIQRSGDDASADAGSDEDAPASDRPPVDFQVGAELVFNYIFTTRDTRYSHVGGGMAFNRFGVRVEGAYGDLFFTSKYLWQSFGDYVRFGYMGYRPREDVELQLGFTHQPFGVRPFLTNAFIFGLPYLLGMEDDSDAGIKLLYRPGRWDFRLAVFKSDEYSGSRLSRWAPDVTVADLDGDGIADEGGGEANQVNARVAYHWKHAENAMSEIGISGRAGQLVAPLGGDAGHHWAAAVHLDGRYGPVGIKALAGRYEHAGAGGSDDDLIAYGALGTAYALASAGTVVALNASWSSPIAWGPLEQLSIYNDFSAVVKSLADSHPTIIDISGLVVSAGPAFAHLDVLVVKNHPFFGTDPADGLGAGITNEWSTFVISSLGFGF